MITYDFYKNEYLGSQIPEFRLPEMIARANAWLEALERDCTVKPYGPNSRDMALCAIAETMEVFRRHWQIRQASIDGVSVVYDADSDKKLQRQLLQNVAGYLEICRGVGV